MKSLYRYKSKVKYVLNKLRIHTYTHIHTFVRRNKGAPFKKACEGASSRGRKTKKKKTNKQTRRAKVVLILYEAPRANFSYDET